MVHRARPKAPVSALLRSSTLETARERGMLLKRRCVVYDSVAWVFHLAVLSGRNRSHVACHLFLVLEVFPEVRLNIPQRNESRSVGVEQKKVESPQRQRERDIKCPRCFPVGGQQTIADEQSFTETYVSYEQGGERGIPGTLYACGILRYMIAVFYCCKN